MNQRQPERRAGWPEYDDRMTKIEADLRPLSRMYWAIVGSGAVIGAMLALLVFIYLGDRDAAKQMQLAIYEQGTAIKVMINRLDNLNEHHKALESRVEKIGP
jgi:hypothetical protein